MVVRLLMINGKATSSHEYAKLQAMTVPTTPLGATVLFVTCFALSMDHRNFTCGLRPSVSKKMSNWLSHFSMFVCKRLRKIITGR
mgnify:CR=1 FL=1